MQLFLNARQPSYRQGQRGCLSARRWAWTQVSRAAQLFDRFLCSESAKERKAFERALEFATRSRLLRLSVWFPVGGVGSQVQRWKPRQRALSTCRDDGKETQKWRIKERPTKTRVFFALNLSPLESLVYLAAVSKAPLQLTKIPKKDSFFPPTSGVRAFFRRHDREFFSIYTCMYICIHMPVCRYTCVCKCTHIYIYIYIYILSIVECWCVKHTQDRHVYRCAWILAANRPDQIFASHLFHKIRYYQTELCGRRHA